MNKAFGVITLVALTGFAVPACAEDFPATPLNKAAPTNLPGENLVPGLPEALSAVNAATAPLLQPLLNLGPPVATAAAEAPAPAHHLHYRVHHRLVSHLERHHVHHTV